MKVLLFCALLVSAAAVALRRPQAKERLDYSDELGRFKLMPMSAAAYSDEPETCIDNTFGVGICEKPQQFKVDCDFVKDTCSAFITASHQDEAIIIAFRGTDSYSQVEEMFDGSNFIHENFAGGGKASRYFVNAYKDIWAGGLKDAYFTLKNKFPKFQVWITGHNTGGSIASIAAASMVYDKVVEPANVILVTFGQLRTGNQAYVDAHQKLVPSSFRVVHKRDMIAHLPTLDFEGFFVHHGQEVWYDNDMGPHDSYVQCDEGESKDCSDSLFFTLSSSDNYHYYGTEEAINKYGINGCKE